MLRHFTCLLVALGTGAPATAQATFTVTSTADAGAGSLRQAIIGANASAGADVIAFDIPGLGPHTIQPLTALPAITDPVTVDGLSQPGASCASWPATLQVELDGSALTATPFGLTLSGGGSTVRGLVINGFDGVLNNAAGILITTDDNAVECTHIGTNVAGTAGAFTQQNETGILIDGGDGNTIGGTTPSARNLISNNDDHGVVLRGGATGNRIAGNVIGTDASGTAAIENNIGVFVADAPGTIVGGADHDAGVCNRSCNLISGNNSRGIEVDGEGGDGAVIQGNFIGTDLMGMASIPNGSTGIYIDAGSSATGSANHRIGGATDPGVCSRACNLISGNGGGSEGIRLDDTLLRSITVQGNFIGTNASGMAALPNQDGLKMEGVGHQIGGAEPGLGNLISGNERYGIDALTYDAVLEGNLVGTAADGASPLGNGDVGVRVIRTGNRVGGTAPGEGNTIAYNGAEGIFHSLNSAEPENARNPFLGNAIFSNGGRGIRLCVFSAFMCAAETPNDAADGDEGTNRLQNHPDLASATGDGGPTLTLTYAVDTAPAHAAYPLRVEFFLADADGEEGRTFLGADSYPEAAAQAQRQVTFSTDVAVADGDLLVATATDAAGNTSEFSASVVLSASTTAAAPEAPGGGVRLSLAPNPASGTATVSLTLAAPVRTARVVVYDVLGRRMAVTHDGPLAAGAHAFGLDTSGFPAGSYLVRATTGAGVASRTVTVVR